MSSSWESQRFLSILGFLRKHRDPLRFECFLAKPVRLLAITYGRLLTGGWVLVCWGVGLKRYFVDALAFDPAVAPIGLKVR